MTTVEGAKLLRKAGEAADELLASKNLFLPDRLNDLRNACLLRDTRDDSEFLAKLAKRTEPFARGIRKVRMIDQKLRAQRGSASG